MFCSHAPVVVRPLVSLIMRILVFCNMQTILRTFILELWEPEQLHALAHKCLSNPSFSVYARMCSVQPHMHPWSGCIDWSLQRIEFFLAEVYKIMLGSCCVCIHDVYKFLAESQLDLKKDVPITTQGFKSWEKLDSLLFFCGPHVHNSFFYASLVFSECARDTWSRLMIRRQGPPGVPTQSLRVRQVMWAAWLGQPS